MQKDLKVTLAHPNPAPFVQQVGRALWEAKMLVQFVTTFVARPDQGWQKSLNHLTQAFDVDLEKQFSRRAVTEFPPSFIKDYPFWEITRTLVGQIDKDKRLTDVIFHQGLRSFDQWVATHGLKEVNAVYGYEYACLATFQAAQRQRIACIYDVPSPEHDFVENLLQQELEDYPELCTPYRKYVKVRQEQRTERRRQEWHLANVVIANSEFTKASYAASGLDVAKVRVVPYGAPPVCAQGVAGGSSDQEPTQFLWAGTFSIRKGAHYLLQSWKRLKSTTGVRLNVYGARPLPASLLQGLPASLEFSGTVPRSELYELYRKADVLVFPTLCDGFGMVVTEAFAQGLPVITTNQAGAADLVQHGVNGLIVPAGDVDALTAALDWCASHPQELKAMRQAALETAVSWQWSDYRRALIENLLDGLAAVGY